MSNFKCPHCGGTSIRIQVVTWVTFAAGKPANFDREDLEEVEPRAGGGASCLTCDGEWRIAAGTADHPERQRAARYRDHVIAYRTVVAQALLLLDAAREPRDAAYAVAAEDGPPPEAFVGDEAHYFASLWRHYTHDLGYAAEGVHGDGGGCDEETDVGAVFKLRAALNALDDLIAQFTKDFDFSVECARAESA